MRCVNCGWDNQPGAATCIKCGQPLQNYSPVTPQPDYREESIRATVVGGAMPMSESLKATVIGTVPDDADLRKTRVMGDDSMMEPLLKPAVLQQAGGCPNCGYPVAEDTVSCPNCGTPIASEKPRQEPPRQTDSPAPAPMAKPVAKQAQPAKPTEAMFTEVEHIACQNCGYEATIDDTFCPKCGERMHMPTLRGFRHVVRNKPKIKFSLTIIPEEGEEIEPIVQEYEGKNVVLDRNNTEPDNRTITSKGQAEITYDEGHWYIDNLSKMQSTFLQVSRPLEIMPGDVIVLGDRKFIFESNNSK